jgi:hypothetical protein
MLHRFACSVVDLKASSTSTENILLLETLPSLQGGYFSSTEALFYTHHVRLPHNRLCRNLIDDDFTSIGAFLSEMHGFSCILLPV